MSTKEIESRTRISMTLVIMTTQQCTGKWWWLAIDAVNLLNESSNRIIGNLNGANVEKCSVELLSINLLLLRHEIKSQIWLDLSRLAFLGTNNAHMFASTSHEKRERRVVCLFVAYICNLIRSEEIEGKLKCAGFESTAWPFRMKFILQARFGLNFRRFGWLTSGARLLKCFPQLWLNTNFNPSSRQIYQNCVCLIPHDRRCLKLGLSESKVDVWTFARVGELFLESRPPKEAQSEWKIHFGCLRRRLTPAMLFFRPVTAAFGS